MYMLRHIILSHIFILFFVAAIAGPESAQAKITKIPENASPNSRGKGWECKPGYREVKKGICSAIKIPANAFPTNDSYGRGWECKWGFKHIVNTCKKIVIPPNGYLDANSYDWECLRGFRRASNHNDSILKESCVRIEVPENGYLADSTIAYARLLLFY